MKSDGRVRAWAEVAPLRVVGRPVRLVPFVIGYEPIPESLSIADGSDYRWLLEPVTAAAIVYREGWILIDGGFDVTALEDLSVRRSRYTAGNYTPVVPPGDPLREQVEQAGLSFGDLAAAAISHAHFDHTGAVRLVPAGVPVLLQRRELAYLQTAEAAANAVLADDVLRPGAAITVLDDDVELAPGLTAIDTRGHTPGHQSFVVDLPGRRVVLACDAADLRENITIPRACGSTVGPEGGADAQAAAERLHLLDGLPDTEVWPSHDPEWAPWRAVIAEQIARHPDFHHLRQPDLGPQVG